MSSRALLVWGIKWLPAGTGGMTAAAQNSQEDPGGEYGFHLSESPTSAWLYLSSTFMRMIIDDKYSNADVGVYDAARWNRRDDRWQHSIQQSDYSCSTARSSQGS
jgi:hypothetical protein